MGKMVVFWSPVSGKAKVTSTVCAVSGMFGLEYPELRIAVCSNDKKMDLEGKLDGRKELYERSGLALLRQLCRQSALCSEKIRRCAIPLQMKSLYLYPNATREEEQDALIFQLITRSLKEEFDILFLDVENGKQEESMAYLAAADFVVVVLPQDIAVWKRFIPEEEVLLKRVNYCILIGGYLEDSRYNKNFFARKSEVKTKGTIAGVIPMNSGFFDAMQEGKCLDYLYKNQKCRKREENYEFMVQTKQATEYIKKNIYVL